MRVPGLRIRRKNAYKMRAPSLKIQSEIAKTNEGPRPQDTG